MTGKCLLALLGLFLITLLPACATKEPQPKTFELFGMKMGQEVPANMICVSGTCLDADSPFKKKHRAPIASYTKKMDVTHWGPVWIRSPQYEFFQGKLYRILFELECRPKQAKANMDAIAEQLSQMFHFPHRKTGSFEEGGVKSEGIGLWTDDGLAVLIERRKQGKQWRKPYVKIVEEKTLEKVRLALNPNYPKFKKRLLKMQHEAKQERTP